MTWVWKYNEESRLQIGASSECANICSRVTFNARQNSPFTRPWSAQSCSTAVRRGVRPNGRRTNCSYLRRKFSERYAARKSNPMLWFCPVVYRFDAFIIFVFIGYNVLKLFKKNWNIKVHLQLHIHDDNAICTVKEMNFYRACGIILKMDNKFLWYFWFKFYKFCNCIIVIYIKW
jgi:hypothetical protein